MNEEQKSAMLTVRCSKELKDRLQAFADEFGIETAVVIRMSLEDYMERNRDAESLVVKPTPPPVLTRKSKRVVTPETKAALQGAAQVAKRTPRA